MYYYANEYEFKIGVPYFRFKINFSKSLIETFYYVVILVVFLAYQCFAVINPLKLNIIIRSAIFCSVNYIYYILVLLPYNEFKLKKFHFIVSLVLSVLITIGMMFAFVNFPLNKNEYTLFEIIKIFYSLIAVLLYIILAFMCFFMCTIKFFNYTMSPNQLKFEMLRINNAYYAIVSRDKDEIVLAKLKKKNEKFYIIKSDYLIVSSINNRKLQYIKIEFE